MKYPGNDKNHLNEIMGARNEVTRIFYKNQNLLKMPEFCDSRSCLNELYFMENLSKKLNLRNKNDISRMRVFTEDYLNGKKSAKAYESFLRSFSSKYRLRFPSESLQSENRREINQVFNSGSSSVAKKVSLSAVFGGVKKPLVKNSFSSFMKVSSNPFVPKKQSVSNIFSSGKMHRLSKKNNVSLSKIFGGK